MECEHTCEASEATSFSAQTRQKGFYEMEDIGNGFQKKMKHNEQSGSFQYLKSFAQKKYCVNHISKVYHHSKSTGRHITFKQYERSQHNTNTYK